MIPPGRNDTLIEWTKGGAMSVDFTTVLFVQWGDVPDIVDDGPQPSPSEAISSSISSMGGDSTVGSIFCTMTDTSDFQIGETIAVIAVANVDKSWEMQPDN
eukprot:12297325-Ditylum_brightwellii.AAC.1